ncbi:deoxynucleotidyltransferase terminal-interacting protein 1 isoform X2 [Ursus arctos]|uniref:deoxynucleotidyltransferase terminal-interacting protein 1 isoform X2 n=1 Tax=Ursus arctos TaxID=9644 RepID=UPI002016E7D8|nr:deoxynucleotidyltransferase terminal-interacting protein 1 isoform X2 [Ursus arctos]
MCSQCLPSPVPQCFCFRALTLPLPQWRNLPPSLSPANWDCWCPGALSRSHATYPTRFLWIGQGPNSARTFYSQDLFWSALGCSRQALFFQKAALNVRDNVGEEVDAEQLIQEACRSCLEQAKLLFSDGEKVIPRLTHELPGIKRGRQTEEECAHRGSPVPKKRKGRPPGHMLSNDRAAAGMVWKPKSCEPIRREGPKWDPARLNESTTFVLGSRANKALGMGGTRGRIYIKHPHLFKYAADPQDKHWLAEQHHMRATGGKMAYLLIEEDIRDLAASDDYRGCLDLKLEELKSFVLPSWMVEKMRKYMETLRTENEHRAVEAPPQT